MFNVQLIAALVGAFIAGILLDAWFAAGRKHTELERQQRDNAQLTAQLAAEQQRYVERDAALDEARQQLKDSFAALSSRALKENNEAFLRLARENLTQFQVQAEAELQRKEKAVETLVKPIREAMEKNEQQMQAMEKDRATAHGSLTQHLNLMAVSQVQLQLETRNLVQALRRPEVRGQWGELTLRRLAELAGMVEYCDFYEQVHHATAEGGMRPDLILRMPERREIVIDAKTPLDAYLSAVEAVDDQQRTQHLKRHARGMRERVKALASKQYWTQFKDSPDFVVLFIPGDQFLSSALQHDPALLEDALRDKVILATPTSLIALLRIIAYGWRQQAVNENAEKIRALGEELYKRVYTFTEHLTGLGKSLSSSVDQYNKAVGSLERQLLPGARRFTELGINPAKQLSATEQLDRTTRVPARKD
ncbi:MAG: DNA recombination protein RmuC [Gammaproteobacteria bacterium]|nr:DNA recombination protein RmuC [Gammaproteobacteria bacterium]